MNLRRSRSYQRHFRAALSALEPPSLTSAAVLGSAAWIGTAIPAAALLAPGAGASQTDDMTMSLRSALLGIHDNAAGFGFSKSPVAGRPGGVPTLARLEALRSHAEHVVVHVTPIVVQVDAAAKRSFVSQGAAGTAGGPSTPPSPTDVGATGSSSPADSPGNAPQVTAGSTAFGTVAHSNSAPAGAPSQPETGAAPLTTNTPAVHN